MRKIFLGMVFMLSACASNSGVQPFNEDVLFIARQGSTGFSDPLPIRQSAMNEARAYCGAKSLKFELVELIEAQPPFILGKFPRAEVRFRCVVLAKKPD